MTSGALDIPRHHISLRSLLVTFTLAIVTLSACGGADETTPPSAEPGASGANADSVTDTASDGTAIVTLTGTSTYTGQGEMLCSYFPGQNSALANFFSAEQNDLALPVMQIYTLGEFDGAAGGGAVTNATYIPDTDPVFGGPAAEGTAIYTGSAELIEVDGAALTVDGTTIEFKGSCVPTVVVD